MFFLHMQTMQKEDDFKWIRATRFGRTIYEDPSRGGLAIVMSSANWFSYEKILYLSASGVSVYRTPKKGSVGYADKDLRVIVSWVWVGVGLTFYAMLMQSSEFLWIKVIQSIVYDDNMNFELKSNEYFKPLKAWRFFKDA